MELTFEYFGDTVTLTSNDKIVIRGDRIEVYFGDSMIFEYYKLENIKCL